MLGCNQSNGSKSCSIYKIKYKYYWIHFGWINSIWSLYLLQPKPIHWRDELDTNRRSEWWPTFLLDIIKLTHFPIDVDFRTHQHQILAYMHAQCQFYTIEMEKFIWSKNAVELSVRLYVVVFFYIRSHSKNLTDEMENNEIKSLIWIKIERTEREKVMKTIQVMGVL